MRRFPGVVLGAVLLLGACSTSSRPVELGEGAELRLGRTIEDILAEPGATVAFEVASDGDIVFSESYELEPTGLEHIFYFDTLSVPRGSVDVTATLAPSGATCSTTVDLDPGIGMSVSALLLFDGCFLEVIEIEEWRTDDGELVPEEELIEFFGSGHCGWESVRFIAFGGYFEGDAYIRDPEGVFDEAQFVSSSARDRLDLDRTAQANAANLEPGDYLTLDLDSSLPDEPMNLGYRRGLRELFFDAGGNGDYLYVATPDGLERWPRVVPHPACA